MIDIESASSGGLGAILVAAVGYGVKYLRSRGHERRHDQDREDKRLSDCEERFKAQTAATESLGKRLDELQNRYAKDTVNALIESTRALTTAAEVQREGNIVQRDQTKAINLLCVKLADSTPPKGNAI